jgi:hypothetical protein
MVISFSKKFIFDFPFIFQRNKSFDNLLLKRPTFFINLRALSGVYTGDNPSHSIALLAAEFKRHCKNSFLGCIDEHC